MSVLTLPNQRLRAGRLRPAVRTHAGTLWPAATVALLALLAGHFAFVGGDAVWLAALGRIVTAHGIPTGIPFAHAATGHWQNTLVLSELCFYWLEHSFGDAGLIAAQTFAVGGALSLLAAGARRAGAGTWATCGALALVFLGALSSFTIVRLQMFSLVMFPLLLAILRADSRRPSAWLWIVLPLLALWSNLHGAAVIGLLLLYPYLLVDRLRRAPGLRVATVALGLLAPLALCATPAGIHTPAYYEGLLTNLAAQRGVGMWAALGTGPLDVLLVVAALTLGLFALRSRRLAAWELVVAGALAIATVKASRDGVWLLFVLLAPAAVGMTRRLSLGAEREPALPQRAGRRPAPPTDADAGPGAGRGVSAASPPRRDWAGLLPLAAALLIVLTIGDLARWSAIPRAAPAPVARAVALAHGSPILADALTAERIALDGGRIWAGNPIDAFSRSTQALYLDFVGGESAGASALRRAQIRIVLLRAGSAASRLVAGDRAFRLLADTGGYALYQRL